VSAGQPYSYVVAILRRDRGANAAKRRASARDWTIPIVGAITPVGLIVVNVAAFIVKHLAEFRWTIAILAFVSGVMLNSWAGLNIYRVIQRRRPDHPLVNERNQEVVLVAGMALIVVAAFLTALFCYLGLSNANELPNGLTFVTGILAFLVPILLQAAFRGAYRRKRPDFTPSTPSPPPVPPAPGVANRT